jgi:hypothetical protein
MKSSTVYLVGQQQYSGNPMLHYHGKTECFYIDSYIFATNNKKETFVAFRWQQQLH